MIPPSTSPLRMASTMATGQAIPTPIRIATSIPDSAATLPTDRSIPEVRITTVIPIATMPVRLDCCSRFARFCDVRNCGAVTDATTNSAMKMNSRLNRTMMFCRRVRAVPAAMVGAGTAGSLSRSVIVGSSCDDAAGDVRRGCGSRVERRDVLALVHDPDLVAVLGELTHLAGCHQHPDAGFGKS